MVSVEIKYVRCVRTVPYERTHILASSGAPQYFPHEVTGYAVGASVRDSAWSFQQSFKHAFHSIPRRKIPLSDPEVSRARAAASSARNLAFTPAMLRNVSARNCLVGFPWQPGTVTGRFGRFGNP